MGSVKDQTEIIKGPSCNQSGILEGSHQDLDTLKVR